MDTTGNHPTSSALDRMTESVAAKLAVRVLLPLLTLVSIHLVIAQWTSLRDDIGAMKATQVAQSEKTASLERQVTTIDTKLDAGLIWRLTQLERRFEAMEERVERRDAAAPRRN